MTKQQEEKIKEITGVSIVGIFFVIFLMVVIIIVSNRTTDLQTQLQSCQEKIPVWTLNVVCYYNDGGVIKSWRNFTDYEKYLDHKEFYSRGEKCEVIK